MSLRATVPYDNNEWKYKLDETSIFIIIIFL